MNLRQLEAFRATLRSGSITGAAKLLAISQPSVTRLIKELEKSVGFPLFARSGRGLASTVDGRRFGDAVQSMFTGTDELRETAAAIRDSTHGEVQMGVTPVLLYQVTPEAIAKLHQNKPDLKVGLKVDNSSGLIDSVIMQRLDVAVVNVYRRPDTLHVLYERVLHYVCLLPEQHFLARSTESVDLNILEHLDCVAYDRTRLQSAQHDWLRLLSWPQASLSSYSNIAVAALARATGKLAIVDPYTAKTIAALGGVVTRPITQQLTSTLCVVARGVDTLSLAARELADAVIAELELT